MCAELGAPSRYTQVDGLAVFLRKNQLLPENGATVSISGSVPGKILYLIFLLLQIEFNPYRINLYVIYKRTKRGTVSLV
jgi:hypothetical protein